MYRKLNGMSARSKSFCVKDTEWLSTSNKIYMGPIYTTQNRQICRRRGILTTEMWIYYFVLYVSKIILLFIQIHCTFTQMRRVRRRLEANSASDFIIIVSWTSILRLFDMKQFIYAHYTWKKPFLLHFFFGLLFPFSFSKETNYCWSTVTIRSALNIGTWKVLYELMKWKNGHETNLLSFTNCCARNNQCGIWNAPFNKRTIKRFFTLNVIVFINRIQWCFREIEEKGGTFNIKRKKKEYKSLHFHALAL